MSSRHLGVVRELWRYPVKSMLGERVEQLAVDRGGAVGDRAWALRSAASGRILSAKKFPRLLEFKARFLDGATPDAEIELPGGKKILASDSSASAAVSELLGLEARLEPRSAAAHERAEIDPDTIFGDVPIEKVMPGLTRKTMPDDFRLPSGSFFDSAVIHVLASASLEHLRRLQGGTAILDARRFRPNVYVDTPESDVGFVEDQWLSGTLAIADARIDSMKPALRCVMTTVAQSDLPRDLSILRTVAQQHQDNLGVFASIKTSGLIRLGDTVSLVE